MSKTGSFHDRVVRTKQLVETAKKIIRVLREVPNGDSEHRLSEQMVSLRDQLVSIRDDIGFNDVGGSAVIDGELHRSFSAFNDGTKTILTAYLSIQDKRAADVSWEAAATEIDNLVSGIDRLWTFLAIAFAVEHELTIEAARRQVRLLADRERIGQEATAKQGDLSGDDIDSVKPEYVATLYGVSTRTMRDFLVENLTPIREGRQGLSYLFSLSEAEKLCDGDGRFTRISDNP